MGKDSTLTVSRVVALDTIEKYLHRASNEVLEDMLYALVGDKHCYNFTVNTYGEDDVTVENLSLPDECRATKAEATCPTCHREA